MTNTVPLKPFLSSLLIILSLLFIEKAAHAGEEDGETGAAGAAAPRVPLGAGLPTVLEEADARLSDVRLTITPEISNEDLDTEVGKFIQAQWPDDYKKADAEGDDGKRLEGNYSTANSVFRRFLLPLAAVGGPTLGFIPDESTRAIIIGVTAAVGAVFTVTAEWTEYEKERQAIRKTSVDVFLTRVREEIFKDARVKERFSALSEARIEASLTRILSKTETV